MVCGAFTVNKGHRRRPGVGWLQSDFRIHSVPQVVLMVLLGGLRYEQVGCNCLMITIKPTLISETIFRISRSISEDKICLTGKLNLYARGERAALTQASWSSVQVD